CFSATAINQNYIRPTLTEKPKLEINVGRHPVIENLLPSTEKFIPNDLTSAICVARSPAVVLRGNIFNAILLYGISVSPTSNISSKLALHETSMDDEMVIIMATITLFIPSPQWIWIKFLFQTIGSKSGKATTFKL
ncbi:MAG: hypothetical protein QF569_26850, partial [Candidatus Poribacteria bacterium]|nr:hypothetical protein [Candidatus Poribacteria bacterium]